MEVSKIQKWIQDTIDKIVKDYENYWNKDEKKKLRCILGFHKKRFMVSFDKMHWYRGCELCGKFIDACC